MSEQFWAGAVAGASSTIVLHPFDLIKVRLQTSQTAPSPFQSFKALSLLYKSDSIKGLYRGLSANFAGSTLSWGLYFFIYEHLKSLYTAEKPINNFGYIWTSSVASILTVAVTNPIWVLKTRLFLQTSDTIKYRGLMHGLSLVFKEEGMRGLYKGFVPGLIGISHGAIQFTVYENLKKNFADLSTKHFLLFSTISKLAALSITYPYQVVRSRLQDHRQNVYQGGGAYTSMKDVVSRTYKFEGIKGFYKGLSVNALRILPQTWITFVVYENAIKFLKSQ